MSGEREGILKSKVELCQNLLDVHGKPKGSPLGIHIDWCKMFSLYSTLYED